MIITAYTELPEHHKLEDMFVLTYGDYLITVFTTLSFSLGIEELLTKDIPADKFVEYLEDVAEKSETSVDKLYGGHFTAKYVQSIVKAYYYMVEGGWNYGNK